MKNQYYKTSNFYLSAYLICLGMELIDIDRKDRKRAVFIFADVHKRSVMVNQFIFGKEALVDARQFANALKELKNKLYS